MASSFPKMQKRSASFSQSIRNRLRLKKLQAQAKNFCRVLDIRVAQIVEANGLQTMLVQKATPHSCKRLGTVFAAVFLGENQTGILKGWTHCQFVADVLGVCLFQLCHHLGSHCQITDTGGTLGSLSQGTLVSDDLILANMDNSVDEVYMLPAQGKNLTTA